MKMLIKSAVKSGNYLINLCLCLLESFLCSNLLGRSERGQVSYREEKLKNNLKFYLDRQS